MYTHHLKTVRAFTFGLTLLVILTTACSSANNSKPTQTPVPTILIKEPFPPTETPFEIKDPPPPTEASGSGQSGNENSQPGEGNAQLIVHPGFAGVNDVGYLHIAGYVENRTGEWLQGVKVYVKLFDKDGNELTAGSTTGDSTQRVYALNDVVPPDGIAYFEFVRETTAIKGEYDHFELTTEAVASDVRAKLDVSNVTTEGMSEKYILVNGTLTNNSAETCGYPTAVIVAFSGGQVFSVEGVSPADLDALEAGKTVDFKATVANDQLKIDKIEVVGGCAGK